MTVLDAALDYASRGWPIVPLEGKVPWVKDWPRQASTDPAVIRGWWRDRPSSNVGLVTGARSGVWVLDVDTKQGGLEQLAQLEREHGVLRTRTVRTGSGGLHLLWRMPEGVPLANRQGVFPGIDVRATGGQVAAPPSVHPGTGRPYRLENELEIAEPPAWLVELVKPVPPARPAYTPPVVADTSDRERRFASQSLVGACTDIVAAKDGDRHRTLHDKAVKLGGYIAAGLLDEETVLAELQRAGEAVGKSAREVSRTVRDGVVAGKQRPFRPDVRPEPAQVTREQALAWWDQHPEASSREAAQVLGVPAATLRQWASRAASRVTPPPVTAPVTASGPSQPAPVTVTAPPVTGDRAVTPPPVTAPVTGAATLADPLARLASVGDQVAGATTKPAKAEPLYDLLGDRAWLRAMGAARASDPLYGRAELGRLGEAYHGARSVVRQIEEAIGEAQRQAVADARAALASAPRTEEKSLPRLLLGDSYHDTATELLPHLAKGGRVFQRARKLVHVGRDGRATYGVETPVQAPSIDTFGRAALLNEISRCVQTWKTTVTSEGRPTQKPTLCPGWVAEAVLGLDAYPFPLLQGLTQIPIVRPSGTIRVEPGYDPETGYYHEPTPGLEVDIPAVVSRDDALDAVGVLLDPLVDFPFEAGHHRSAVLAALLTLVARPAIKGPAPLFLFTATTPKSGKTKLADIAIGIATGRRAARMSPVEEEAELEKRIFASLMAGHPSVLIDNIDGAFGGPSLDALLTSYPEYEGRELGLSKTHRVPARTVWMASGNNISIRGDLAQRVIPVHLVPDVERPELRSGFRHPEVVDMVIEHRDVLLSAAYGLLRGYIQAGRPDVGLSPFGGFEAWSRLVRGALVWAGQPDPYAGVAALSEAADERRSMVEGLLSAWHERWGTDVRWLADMPGNITADSTPALWSAVSQLCMGKDHRVDTVRMGHVLRRWAGRIIGGFRIEPVDQKRHGARGWVVRRVGAESAPPTELEIPY